MTTGQAPDTLLVLDTRNQEHYLNWANVVEVHFYRDGKRLKANILTTAPAAGTGGDLRSHTLIITDASAEALRAELRRRSGLPEDAPLPESAPGLRLSPAVIAGGAAQRR